MHFKLEIKANNSMIAIVRLLQSKATLWMEILRLRKEKGKLIDRHIEVLNNYNKLYKDYELLKESNRGDLAPCESTTDGHHKTRHCGLSSDNE